MKKNYFLLSCLMASLQLVSGMDNNSLNTPSVEQKINILVENLQQKINDLRTISQKIAETATKTRRISQGQYKEILKATCQGLRKLKKTERKILGLKAKFLKGKK